jgi:hypothetical protein
MIPDWAVDLLRVIGVGVLVPILRQLYKIRHNDLEHIDAKLDRVSAQVALLSEKLTSHLNWHRKGD